MDKQKQKQLRGTMKEDNFSIEGCVHPIAVTTADTNRVCTSHNP